MLARTPLSHQYEATAQSFRDAEKVPPYPPGWKPKAEAKALWKVFCRGRALDSWLPHELVIVSRIVDLQIQIQANEKAMLEDGIVNSDGVINARLRVAERLQALQLALIRSLSLNTTTNVAHSVKTRALKQDKAHRILDAIQDDGLLAR